MSADGIAHGTGDCIQRCGDAVKGCAAACTCAASGIPCYTITINAGTQIYGGYYFRWAAQTIVVTNQGGYCHWSGCWNLEYSPDNSTWTAATGACWLGFDTGCYFAIFMQTVIGGVTYWVGAGKRTLSPGYNQMPDGGYSPWDGAWTDMGWVVSSAPASCAYADLNLTEYVGSSPTGPWSLVDGASINGIRVCGTVGCSRSLFTNNNWVRIMPGSWGEHGPVVTVGTDSYGRLYINYPGLGIQKMYSGSACLVLPHGSSGYVLYVLRIVTLDWLACDRGCPEPTWTPTADPLCEEGTSPPPPPPAPCTVTGPPPDPPPSKHCRTIYDAIWIDEDGGQNIHKPGSWNGTNTPTLNAAPFRCLLAAPAGMTDNAWDGSGSTWHYCQLQTETCTTNGDCSGLGTDPSMTGLPSYPI